MSESLLHPVDGTRRSVAENTVTQAAAGPREGKKAPSIEVWNEATRIPAPYLLFASALGVLGAAQGASNAWERVDWIALSVLACAIVIGLLGLWQAMRSRASKAERVSAGSRRVLRNLVFGAMVLHVAVAVRYELRVPAENIDTFTFEREACRRLLHGIDPYGGTEANVYDAVETRRYYAPVMVRDGRVQEGYQYPPATIFWLLPGYLLGDVRFSLVAALIASAWLLFRIRPDAHGAGAALLLLLNPFVWFVENRSWTEPIVLLAFCATVWAAVKKPSRLPVMLGLLLAAKQYDFLVLPLIPLLVRPFGWNRFGRLLLSAIGVAAATALPFALWNVRALVHDIAWFHIVQGFRPDSLSFAVPFHWMLYAGPVILCALFVWILRRAPHTPACFAAAYALALVLFISTSKQAFANYFFMVFAALLTAAAAGTWSSAEEAR